MDIRLLIVIFSVPVFVSANRVVWEVSYEHLEKIPTLNSLMYNPTYLLCDVVIITHNWFITNQKYKDLNSTWHESGDDIVRRLKRDFPHLKIYHRVPAVLITVETVPQLLNYVEHGLANGVNLFESGIDVLVIGKIREPQVLLQACRMLKDKNVSLSLTSLVGHDKNDLFRKKNSQLWDFVTISAIEHHSRAYKTIHGSPWRHESQALNPSSIVGTINQWLDTGMDAQLLNFNIPLSFEPYELTDEQQFEPFSAARLLKDQKMTYREVIKLAQDPSIISNWFEPWKSPYMVQDRKWVPYENNLSISFKIQAMKKMGIHGVSIQPAFDDWESWTGHSFPITRLVHRLVHG